MNEDSPPSPSFTEGDLSKDFGLDITVSDGGLVSSANNQRQYQAECSRIYQQFILNMADYIKEEGHLRKTLTTLQSQKRINPNKSATRRQDMLKTPDMLDEDAFTTAQLEEFKNILNYESSRSRLGHAPGFSTSNGAGDDGVGCVASSMVNQPGVNHMFPALKERPPSVKVNQMRRESKSASCVDGERKQTQTPSVNDMLNVEIEYDGIMDPNADLSNNRRIRMNQKSFTKLMTGQVRVKLLNKTGDFVLTPLTNNSTVLSPDETEKQLMDNKEKVAVVKQRTTFQSPTLSSDLKISNLVAIQKALKGQTAKRVTVGEVMKSARDRRARLFRVQMTGNRFDEFDRQEEDLGYVHEVKAAVDVGGEVDGRRSQSRLRFSPHVNMLRTQEQRPESRLRSPTPIPLHILDPKAAERTQPSRANTPGILKQVSTDYSALTVHKDCSEFEHRYAQAVDQGRPKERNCPQKHLAVIQLDFDEDDGRSVHDKRMPSGTISRPRTDMGIARNPDSRAQSASFSTSRIKREMYSKSALPGRASRLKKRTGGTHTDATRITGGQHQFEDALTCTPVQTVKKIANMRDTTNIVKRWQEDDRVREEKLNRWRLRMSFAATRRGNLAKVLSRVKSGR